MVGRLYAQLSIRTKDSGLIVYPGQRRAKSVRTGSPQLRWIDHQPRGIQYQGAWHDRSLRHDYL